MLVFSFYIEEDLKGRIMKILKKILVVFVVLIAIVLVAGVFMKKDFTVIRSVELDQPINEVYNYVKLLKNQDEYSVWMKMDPNVKKTYTGTDGTVGFIGAWDSKVKDVGVGEQEITAMAANDRIDYVMRFKKPNEMQGTATMLFSEEGDCSKLDWSFSGSIGYPFNVMMPLMDFEGKLGPQLQEGLDNLKVILDNQ